MRVYQLKDSCEFFLTTGEQVQIRVLENDSNIYCFNAEGVLIRKYEEIGYVYLVLDSKSKFLCSSSTTLVGLLMIGDLDPRMQINDQIASYIMKFCHSDVLTLKR